MARYITTPIYYVNDVPHIGHAYTTLAADTLARFYRLKGEDVFLLTGTDEHGQKVEKAARDAGIDPQSFVDQVSQRFQDLASVLGSTHNRFIRTTDADHKEAAQAIWSKLEAEGWIYEDVYEGWYSVRDEAFFSEDEIKDGLAPTGAPVEWVKEPSLFFALSRMQDRLLRFYRDTPEAIQPVSRRNEVIRFVEGGLKDLAISRTQLTWGVPIPHHPKQVMYVWLDALTNYISALGYPDTDNPLFKTYWPQALHIVGKDIVRFHAVYWPAFLMAAGITQMPRIYAHGWWTNEGQKISKSLGNTIDPHALIHTYGVDAVRYFVLREVPFGQDGDFSQTQMATRYQSELANNFGNLVQRVLSFVVKNQILPIQGDRRQLPCCDINLITAAIDQLAFHRALEHIWSWMIEANQYMDHKKPWALRKDDPQQCAIVLYELIERIRQLALLTQPFLPNASKQILDMIKVDNRSFDALETAWIASTPSELPTPLFPQIA